MSKRILEDLKVTCFGEQSLWYDLWFLYLVYTCKVDCRKPHLHTVNLINEEWLRRVFHTWNKIELEAQRLWLPVGRLLFSLTLQHCNIRQEKSLWQICLFSNWLCEGESSRLCQNTSQAKWYSWIFKFQWIFMNSSWMSNKNSWTGLKPEETHKLMMVKLQNIQKVLRPRK